MFTPRNNQKSLPSIEHILTPATSPLTNSPLSPPATFPSPQKAIHSVRKASIASLLNSDPELRRLDEEENLSNYQSHFSNPVLLSIKRGRPCNSVDQPLKKRKSPPSSLDLPRATKGLRHFSKQVCDKVEAKGVTTYNEVADQLAKDIQALNPGDEHVYDQKNIRRRVYDALNVLMAMNIITKNKKEIKWLGIPSSLKSSSEAGDRAKQLQQQIEQEELLQAELISRKQQTTRQLTNKVGQYVKIRQLIHRNQKSPPPDQSIISELPINLTTGYNNEISCEGKMSKYPIYDILDSIDLPFSSHPAIWLPDQSWYKYLPEPTPSVLSPVSLVS
ncbi:transcription factor E2F/dimerization partner [Phycomyces blakesleeanus NRRL 1555(-)]|uniref:Transcription factor E2F/dimerization partner n=1 Tax=Phycomyces blakesleeanus (strain ATCC 8743b / DSM 1359 / FGSC 10004 / NBRC 33097 / NRRL 1555) TaxID=763407 RepID=A0A162ZRP6_PHYB8|nr:transcription factor E2F/dimerization partner [Phycomyces blakesleeanus NRRL 1555(-)]OAD68631.1 transcription factor E2F/dimerization partner [Phycomyces blakesleeanus NRRL 1555(-)]|eukprot:XP_018286671.1 transcription factor E2F/dimerization partner [Phycomyces blakesleeanus NRRL 1555(-)]